MPGIRDFLPPPPWEGPPFPRIVQRKQKYYVTKYGKEILRSPTKLMKLTLFEQRVLDNLADGVARLAQFQVISGVPWSEIEDVLHKLAVKGYVGIR